MELHIPIENLLLINAATPEARESFQAAFVEALKEVSSVRSLRVGQGENCAWVRFYCDWEPPFKQLKAVSKVHEQVPCVLLSDAFAKSHWLSKAEYLGGKGSELTVSRVDDEFEPIFQEVFGKDYASWEAQQTPSFPNY